MRTGPPTPRLRALLLAALVLAATRGGSAAAVAQLPPATREAPSAGSSPTRPLATFPTSGPPGTEVTLRPLHLPAVTPVQVSIGGTRSGFEVLAQMMTDQDGELTGPVRFRVPDWVERDRTYVFMVLDLYFKPLAASDVFYVTGEDGTVLRQGLITAEGTTCPALRGEEGELFTLTGRTGELAPGDSVVVEGTVADPSRCRQGTSIEVLRIRRIPRSDRGHASVRPQRPRPARAEFRRPPNDS